MAKNTKSTGNSGLSANLLPNLYQTPANKKFLQATLDQLFQPGSVTKTSGYIGRKNAKAATGVDLFVPSADTTRADYQLEPGLTVKDSFGNISFFKDYQDYINQIGVFGGNTKNHARLNQQEFYSWDPKIDWDKFVNFQNYYWMSYGPQVLSIYGQQLNITSTYTVDLQLVGNTHAYMFTPNGLTLNPVLKLYRGQTYHFDITSSGNPFSLKTERSTGTIDRYNAGVSGQGTEHGTMTFVVPDNAPNIIYYQSEADINIGGIIEIEDITEATFLNVESDILGKKVYVLSNGTALSNGMLVGFGGNVAPAAYETGQYYVEGVGVAIKLVPASTLEIVSRYTVSEDIQFDSTPFDSTPFDGATGYASVPDYITINRASNDRNPWSRYNRWVHKDVITATAAYNGTVPSLDQNTRAIRPIIEFKADLQLFNMGTFTNHDVDLVDTFTSDVFSTIEGSLGYNIDGIPLANGYKILFTADTDPLVNNKIYQVEFLIIQGRSQIHLTEIGSPLHNEVTLVKRGVKNQSLMYWYTGTEWKKGQQKTNTNQAPLFDVVDEAGISFGDNSVYNGSTFSGTSIFTYKVGTGVNDTALGFPLSYQNVSNIGDIVFNFTLATDTFQYKETAAVITKGVDVGYLISKTYGGDTVYENGWQMCSASTVQAGLRIYYNSNQTNNFDVDIFDNKDDLSDLVVRVYVNGKRLSNASWNLIDTTVYKRVVLDTDIALTDILTIKTFAKQPINSNGHYEIPVNLQNNPLNETMGDFALGEVVDHVNSILDNTPAFIGTFPGAGNLRDLGNVTPHGTKFVQHSGPLSLGMYHITSQPNNIVNAIERSRDDYNNFKRVFLSVAESLGVDAAPDVMVELIMQKVNANKPKTSPYYFSDMVPYGGKIATNLTVVDSRIKTYPLSTVFTLTALSNKAVGIYLNGVQLIHGKDYTFNSQGYLEVTATLTNGDIISTYEYSSTDGSYVPATPSKLGLWPKFEPMVYTDTTLLTPRIMIQGHDGSQMLAYGDYRDDIIVELEKRIFNNIKVEYDPSVFDISDIIPGYNRSNGYTLSEVNTVLAPSFYKWTGLVGVDFTKPLSYDRGNSFTYNYSTNYTPDNTSVPGYWRGVYRWILDTDRPNICPWEMLGFSIRPSWWVAVYGEPMPSTGGYTSDNLLLWRDLTNGVIRQPNVPPIVVAKYARPILLTSCPVDDQGNLVSPQKSGMVNGTVTPSINNNFVFGDVSPVEAAWRRSSHYSFSVLIASMLLTPAKTFGLALDRSRIVRNMAGQLVYSETNLRIKPSDILLPSIESSSTRVQTAGIINYVVDYLLNYVFSNNIAAYNSYQSDLDSLAPQLSYRVGAFTNKAQFNLLLESKTPESSGNVFVPAEDYSIFLNKSSPLKKLTYSGIIITKLSTGFEVKGYSNSQPYFKYYNYLQSGTVVNVGGISATFNVWTAGNTYNVGSIVQYGNAYYNVKVTHTATTFDSQFYSRMPSLPITGGATVQLRNAWDMSAELSAPYGTTFATAQEVVDFMLGYGAWLSDAGFIFDEYNSSSNTINNWETSAKEFLFWTTQNWSSGEDKWDDWTPNQAVSYGSIVRYNGDYFSAIYNIPATTIFDETQYVKMDGLSNIGSSVISLSPAARTISFETTLTVVEDISDAFNSYEIFKVDGTPIAPKDLDSYRAGNRVTYTSTGGDGIYGASFYLIQNEHVVVINNKTIFNDTIYSPASGYRQERIKLAGYVTDNWYGGLDIPGFVFDQANVDVWQQWHDYTAGDIINHQGFYYSANAFTPGSATFNSADWSQLNKKPTSKVSPNWTNLASQFTDFYNLESDSFNVAHQTVAQHLIGYQKRQYLENIIQDDVSEFKFFQGMIREKGTQNVLNKLFDALGADNTDSLTFYEEWALRVGQYGATASFENVEFVLDEGKFKNNPQGFNLSKDVSDTLSSFIIQQTPNDVYLKPAGYDSKPFPALSSYKPFLRSAGFVRPADVALSIGYLSEITKQDVTALTNGDYVWVAFDTSLAASGVVKGWDVYRFTNLNLNITNVTYDGFDVTVETSDSFAFVAGDYIGLTGVGILTGIFQVKSIASGSFTVSIDISNWPQDFTQEADLVVSTFTSQYSPSIDTAVLPSQSIAGELLWTGSEELGNWAVWQYQSVYTKKQLVNADARELYQYGTLLAINAQSSISAITNLTGEIITREKIGISVPWSIRQTIQVPFIANLELGVDLNLNNKIPAAIAFSSDGTWMASGLPLASKVATGTAGTYTPVSNGGNNSTLVHQGMISLYKKDVNNVYTLVDSIVSPNPTANEMFGASLAFANDTLFIAAPGSKKVYKMSYGTTVHGTVSYNPVGSSGAVIVVSSTSGIDIGMRVRGTGFYNDQHVLQVINGTTLRLSGSPSITPSSILEFVTTEWSYTASTITNVASGFARSITVSDDQSTLVVSATSAIRAYGSIDGVQIGSALSGTQCGVSNTGEYIVVSDLVNVKVYQLVAGQYTQCAQLVPHNLSGTFGSKVAFMNDSKTIVVYSVNTGAGIVDVYDQYDSAWTYSETIATTTVSTEYGFVTGLNQVLITDEMGTLFVSSKRAGAYTWTIIHEHLAIPDVSKVKKVFLYNKDLGKLVTYLDVIDPAQGKIPGIADEELKYKSFYDPATYSNVSANDFITASSDTFWSKDQVGMLWWDLRTTKFINSYFDDIVYKNSAWNTLAPSASVDVYEWVETSLLPSAWDEVADTTEGVSKGISGTSLYGDSVYSVRERYDNISKTFNTTYYFWVKNKNIVPEVDGRRISAYNVANLISNPRGQGYSYLALTGVDSFSVVNAKQFLSDASVVLSIEYWLTGKTDQNIHTQWKLISNDSAVSIPGKIEQKWFDSLCGVDSDGRSVPDMKQPPKLRYGIENRPRQSMFVNRIEALKEFVERVNRVMYKTQIVENFDISALHAYDAQPSAITGLYDIILDTDSELRFANASSFTSPRLLPVVSDNGAITGIDIAFAGRGFVIAPYITISGEGTGAVIKAIINTQGQVIGAEVVAGGEGYNQDTTTCTVRSYSVLVQSDSEASGNWSIYAYDTTTASWSRVLTQAYDVRNYWNYIPWYSTGYNQFSAPDYSINTFVELNSLTVKVGELVKILVANTGGWILLVKYAESTSVDWTQSYSIVGMENGTIQLSTALYNFKNTTVGYDAGTYDGDVYDLVALRELRIILDTIKNNIFIGTLKQEYLDLFLSSLRYAHSEQVYIDWAFKTSFVRATHHVGELNQPVTYPVDNLSNFEDFISEVKPYRTHIREYISGYTKTDLSSQAVTDFDLQPVFNDGKISVINSYISNGSIVVDDPSIQNYPWKYWLDNVGFTITDLVLINGGTGYTTQPVVEIVSDSGTGATATAYIANGRVNRIVLVTTGNKYLSAPSVNLIGGGGTGARAIAIIGESVVRSNLVSLKFDRLTQSYFITDLNVSETITATRDRLQYPLTWGPDVKIGNASVTIDGVPVLRDTYKIRIVKSTSAGYTAYSGSITFDTAPELGKIIVVNYLKDISLLNAADRIQHYYNAGTDELGKDITQLMNGIDYGGVQVNGLGFDISGGWDKRPYGSEGWDVYDGSYSDFIVQVAADTHSFTLPYTPEAGVEINIYQYINSITSTPTDIDTLTYYYDVLANYPDANLTTVAHTSGTNAEGINTMVIDSATNIQVGDTVSISVNASGTVLSTTTGVNLITLSSVTGLAVGDKIKIMGNSFGGLAEAIYYILSINGSAITASRRFGGSPINVSTATGSMSFSKVNPLSYGTVVTQINGTTITLNQILFARVLTGTSVTFTRALVEPTDLTIYPNGSALLTSPIPSGSTLNIVGLYDPVRIEQSLITHVGATYSIPNDIVVGEGDKFILRQSTSDGSITPQSSDYDTVVSGGNMAYDTATGLNPEDIVIDGDGFVTPTTSPAPEEVVPGQVVDAVAIKVFDNPENGSGKISVSNYIADGVKLSYKIGQQPNSKDAVIVKINNDVKTVITDYTVDYSAGTVVFETAPLSGVTVTVFSIGFAGTGVLDLDYFVGDGTTVEFITRAPWLGSDNLVPLVYIDGAAVDTELFRTDNSYEITNLVGIRFTTAPSAGLLVSFIIASGTQRTFAITSKELIEANGSFTYTLSSTIGNSLPNESNMLVRVGQNIIQAPNNSYFTIGSNRLNYIINSNKFPPNTVNNSDLVVFADGVLLEYGLDYVVDLNGITIKINRSTYNKYSGKQLIVSITTDQGYVYNPVSHQITFKQAYNEPIEIISSYIHDVLDIQRTTINVSSSVALTPDSAEFYLFKSIEGGKIVLDRPVIDDNYVWINKNGTLLTTSIDYKLLDDHMTILLANRPEANDAIELITFGKNILPASGIAYMQFKDMLNRVHFKRLNANKQTQLRKDLRYNDTEIEVEDASNFEAPSSRLNRPGIIEIRGERIEYFSITGNKLGKLRRGTLGTGAPQVHRAGTYVLDIGASETIPYNDTTVTEQVISNGTNVVKLNFVPASVDEIEVFVGGYDDLTSWAPEVNYAVDKIVRVGSYTYRCVVAHTSTALSVNGVTKNFFNDIANWVFFVGNIRLKKAPYKMFNINVAPYSPAGDVSFDADFTVDGETNQITLTNKLSIGTQVTVVKRTGVEWDSTINIQEADNNISRFLKAQPGTWYTDVKPISVILENPTMDGVSTVDSTRITLDQGN